MSDWYSFPQYNPYDASNVSQYGMLPSPNEVAARRLATMGGGGGYKNDPTQFDQNMYAGRMAGIGAAAGTAVAPELMGAGALGGMLANAIGPAGEADARTSRADLEALRLKNASQKDAAAAKAAQDARDAAAVEAARQARQNDAAEGVRQLNQWRADNAPAISHLAKPWQDAIHSATDLDSAQGAFGKGQDAYRQASMTLAEKYPGPMAWAELGAMGLGAAVPGAGRLANYLGLRGATNRAESAYNTAFGPGAEATEGALNNINLRGNQLNRSLAASQPPTNWFSHNIGPPGELIGATATPWVAGNLLPNSYDYMMGHLSSDPGGLDKAQKAKENVLDPARAGFAGGEGLAGGVVGNFLNRLFPMSNTIARAQGLSDALKTPALQRAMKVGAQAPAEDLGGWSTPQLKELYGGPKAAVQRKADKGGYLTLIQGQ